MWFVWIFAKNHQCKIRGDKQTNNSQRLNWQNWTEWIDTLHCTFSRPTVCISHHINSIFPSTNMGRCCWRTTTRIKSITHKAQLALCCWSENLFNNQTHNIKLNWPCPHRLIVFLILWLQIFGKQIKQKTQFEEIKLKLQKYWLDSWYTACPGAKGHEMVSLNYEGSVINFIR